jgi:hypothetical protein
MDSDSRLDPVFEADRGSGSTPPESGPESADVAGRPAVERPQTAFHEPAETPSEKAAASMPSTQRIPRKRRR